MEAVINLKVRLISYSHLYNFYKCHNTSEYNGDCPENYIDISKLHQSAFNQGINFKYVGKQGCASFIEDIFTFLENKLKVTFSSLQSVLQMPINKNQSCYFYKRLLNIINYDTKEEPSYYNFYNTFNQQQNMYPLYPMYDGPPQIPVEWNKYYLYQDFEYFETESFAFKITTGNTSECE